MAIPGKALFIFGAFGTVAVGLLLSMNTSVAAKVKNRLRNLYIHICYQSDTPEQLGDGLTATEILLHDPMGLARDKDGNIYLSDRGLIYDHAYRGEVVWKIEPGGVSHIIAGNGRRGVPTPGIQATRSNLGSPEGIDVDDEGRVYIADHENNMVLRVEGNGSLTRVAGSGEKGYGGDGGPAEHAKLNRPYDVRLDKLGNAYIADQGNHRIRKIAPDGIIETVAGLGEAGYAGDGGSALLAKLKGPYNIAIDGSGRLLIADSGNHVIRRVNEDGIIETIAGSGTKGLSGDGAPAINARFNTPQSMAIDDDGNIFVSDEDNNRIRVIKPDEVIEGYAGSDATGNMTDGTDREHLDLSDPETLLLIPNVGLLVTDSGHHRVVLIGTDGIMHTFAGRGYPGM
jgi:hypothetical protein